MSLFNRLMVGPSVGLPQKAGIASGFYGNLKPASIATDAALTLTVDQMSGGLVVFTGFTAGRAVTTPTAALILAQCPDMDVGDSFSFIAAVTVAFAATWTAGAGVTLAGRATLPASTVAQVITVTKLTATTVQWYAS
jgi:hypothetical protein